MSEISPDWEKIIKSKAVTAAYRDLGEKRQRLQKPLRELTIVAAFMGGVGRCDPYLPVERFCKAMTAAYADVTPIIGMSTATLGGQEYEFRTHESAREAILGALRQEVTSRDPVAREDKIVRIQQTLAGLADLAGGDPIAYLAVDRIMIGLRDNFMTGRPTYFPGPLLGLLSEGVVRNISS